MSETRKLAAILCSDVVGYSRLAGADEDRILARLRALRSDLIDPTIAVHHGRVVKRTGDGAIVEFRSVVDAVRCAIEVQNAMVERNAGVPEDRRIVFRIGIHIGDVVEESDGDLMGDGVNIAARLEGVAAPGAICLSEQAYWQVKGRLDLAVTDLGPTQLKNIAEPVRAYSLQVGVPSQAKPARPAEPASPAKLVVAEKRSPLVLLGAGIAASLIVIAAGAWFFLGAKGPAAVATIAPKAIVSQGPTVAVLPFVNESGDANNDALATRLAEDTIGYLGNFSWLRIVGRSPGSTKPGGDPIEAARQIGADYVVTGNVRSGAAALRVSFQVDDACSGARIWSTTLQPTAEAVQTSVSEVEVAGRASALIGLRNGGAIADAEFKRMQTKPASELSSYECIVQANDAIAAPAIVARARGCLEAVIEKEPANANAWIALATVLQSQRVFGFGLSVEETASVEKRLYLADKQLSAALHAADLAPGDSAARSNLAGALYDKCQVDRARVEFEKAIALNPYDALTFGYFGWHLAFSGHWDEGTALVDRAIAMLGPSAPWWLWYPVAERHWVRGEYQEAFDAFQHANIEGFWLSHLDLAFTLPFLDRLDEAKAHVAKLLRWIRL